MLWTFVLIFGICEFGERLCGSFQEINDLCDAFAWYSLPCDVQHILPTLIMMAQKPVELRIFGSISCGRITFKNVSK